MKLKDVSTLEVFCKVLLICFTVATVATTVKFVIWLFS